MSSTRRAKSGTAGAGGTRRDPLAATPVAVPGVQAQRDAANLLQLRRPLPTRGRIGAVLERVFGFNRYVRFNLDEQGGWFWERIDGKRDLHAIETELRKRFSLSPEESVKAVIEYTKVLMMRGLICLRLHEAPRDEK